jgi:ABC-type glycerol-3-phosphate transport system permease component
MAGAVVSSIPTILVSLIFQRNFVQDIVQDIVFTGIKL